jgi:hypothetical protein
MERSHFKCFGGSRQRKQNKNETVTALARCHGVRPVQLNHLMKKQNESGTENSPSSVNGQTTNPVTIELAPEKPSVSIASVPSQDLPGDRLARARAYKRRCVSNPQEYKLVSMRECVAPGGSDLCDNAFAAWKYWMANIPTHPFYNPDCECLVVLLLDVRRRAKGHTLVTVGLLDTLLVHAREVFRSAIIGAASAIILIHNHPSGDPSPSPNDITVTRNLIRAGVLLKVNVLDHVIVGAGTYSSLLNLGYFP